MNFIDDNAEQVIREMFRGYSRKNRKADFKSFREGVIIGVGVFAQAHANEVANDR